MRLSSLALALVSVVLAASLLARPTERVAAAYNISGSWMISFDGGPPCPATISQTFYAPGVDDMQLSMTCDPYYPLYVTGNISTTEGGFFVSGTVYLADITMSGTLSADNHTITGTYVEDPMSGSTIYGTFSGTGGAADPKPGSPTPTPTRTSTATPLPPTPTPPPLGGVSLDATTVARSDSTDARWLIALAGTSFVALCGAALFAQRRRGSA